jgi:large repetitive protein
MTHLRKSFFVLAGLFLMGTTAAKAQPPLFTCNASAVPHQVRSEGLTELSGDIILNCTGGVATPYGAAVPLVDVQIFINTQITSKRLVDNSTNWSEALLAIDDPSPANQTYCTWASSLCTNYGNGAGLPIPVAGPINVGGVNHSNANVFQGQIVSSNSLLWMGIPIDPPGSSGTRIIRLTNVRVNANALGVAPPNTTPTAVIAVVSATGPSLAGVNNPAQTIGYTQAGLTASMTVGVVGLQQCLSQDKTIIGSLNYKENFATAFKRSGATDNQNIFGSAATGTYNTESGFQPVGYPQPVDIRGDPNTAGDADFGTRVKAVFNNVPSGVTLWVSLYSGHATTKPVSGEFFAAIGGAQGDPFSEAATTNAPWLKLINSGNTATAVWENFEVGQNMQFLNISNFQLEVAVSYTASPDTNSPALGTMSVSGSYAPVSTVTSAATTPNPRFADTSTASNVLTISACAPSGSFGSTRQMVEQLTASGLIDNAGVSKSLLAHLAAAESASKRGEAKAAQNILNAMANEVRAQAGKSIDPGAARELLEAIGALASAIAP